MPSKKTTSKKTQKSKLFHSSNNICPLNHKLSIVKDGKFNHKNIEKQIITKYNLQKSYNSNKTSKAVANIQCYFCKIEVISLYYNL